MLINYSVTLYSSYSSSINKFPTNMKLHSHNVESPHTVEDIV